MAEIGALSIALDHKWIKGKQGDPEMKALGLLAIVSSEDGTRTPFLIGYIPTDDASDEETLKLVTETFDEFDLLEPFKRLQIPICTDAALRFAVNKIFDHYELDPLKSICSCHNLTNLGKNCLKNLPKYLDDANSLLAQAKQNTNIAGKEFENHFKEVDVNALDRDYLGELLYENWWEKTEIERQNSNLQYQKIPSEFSIRFRNAFERTKGLVSRLPELERIKSNIHHPLHHLTFELDIDKQNKDFLFAVYKMEKHLIQLIEYYESNSTFQSTDSINSLIYGFEFCLNLDRKKDNQYDIAIKMCLLDELTAQLCSHKAIHKDGVWKWTKSGVPTRIGRLDKIGLFAFPGDQKLMLNRLMKMLREAKKSFKSLRGKFQVCISYHFLLFKTCCNICTNMLQHSHQHVATFFIHIITNPYWFFQLLETEISRLCSTWRDQVISTIKEKDRLLNPELYAEVQSSVSAGRNPNLFDDDCYDDNDQLDSNTSSESMSDDDFLFPLNEVSNHSAPLFDSSHDNSNVNIPEAQNSNISSAAKREKEIDDELEKYRNFNKDDFEKLCTENGLSRRNSKKFEPVGSIVWEFWRQNKNKYPIIYECIKCVIQAPTSSSAIEREFSKISAFVTHQKNSFKSKNLLHLIQISEMDNFLRIASDCFRQNNVDFSFKILNEDEISLQTSPLIADDSLLCFD